MLACISCGTQMEDSARFCSTCGERMYPVDPTSTIPLVDDQTMTSDFSVDDVTAIDALPSGSALLVVLKGPGTGSRFLLREDRTVAGRHPESGIFLDDITVSRAHVAFSKDQGSFMIEDLGSLNGTYLNRRLLQAPTRLRNGDEVQIGKYKMIFFLGSAGIEGAAGTE